MRNFSNQQTNDFLPFAVILYAQKKSGVKFSPERFFLWNWLKLISRKNDFWIYNNVGEQHQCPDIIKVIAQEKIIQFSSVTYIHSNCRKIKFY